jgi:hypothetical protein
MITRSVNRAAQWLAGMRARLNAIGRVVDEMPTLPWTVTDPGRQGGIPFSNCFNPCDTPFYNAYSETVPHLCMLQELRS